MKIIYFILIALSLASCSPERRLARLIDKHPELIKSDTVYVTVTVPADTVIITDHVTVEADSAGVSSVVGNLLNAIAGMDAPAARTVAERIIRDNVRTIVKFPSDTITYDTERVKGKVWFDSKGKMSIETVVKEYEIEVPVETNTVQPVKNMGWIERLFWIILLSAGLLYGLKKRFFA